MSDVLTPQPSPTNEAGDLWATIIAREEDATLRDLFAARREQGIAKYGRPLGLGNGRDFRADAIQEALDGLVYAEGLGDSPEASWVRTMFRGALRALLTLERIDPDKVACLRETWWEAGSIVRTDNALRKAGYPRVVDVLGVSDRELMMVRNFGNQCLRDVKAIIEAIGPVTSAEIAAAREQP